MKTQSTTMREIRTPLSGTLHCCIQDNTASAQWVNVSRVGACIVLDRAVTPETLLELYFDSPLETGIQVCVPGHVVWCAQESTHNGLGWRVGLRMYRKNPEAALAFASLGYQARRGNAAGSAVKQPYWAKLQALPTADPDSQDRNPAIRKHKDNTGSILTS